MTTIIAAAMRAMIPTIHPTSHGTETTDESDNDEEEFELMSLSWFGVKEDSHMRKNQIMVDGHGGHHRGGSGLHSGEEGVGCGGWWRATTTATTSAKETILSYQTMTTMGVGGGGVVGLVIEGVCRLQPAVSVGKGRVCGGSLVLTDAGTHR